MSGAGLAPADRLVTLPQGLPELTLGWEAIRWGAKYLRQPNGQNAGKRWNYIDSQARFMLWWYAVDEDGAWLFNHGVRRLAKGSGKSPFAAAFCLTEFCAPVRLHDFDPKVPGGCVGRPVGLPWVQVAATNEKQTANTMRMIRAMTPRKSRLVRDYDLDPGKTQITRPDGGQIEVITSSAGAAEGSEITAAVGDETEHWLPSRGGPDLAETLDRNLGKSGSRMIETCNAWSPGVGSVAETSWLEWVAQQEGRTRGRARTLYDARVAPADLDLADEVALRQALQFVYDDCHWVDLQPIIDRIYSSRTPVQVSRQYYLNQPTASADAWLTGPQWAGAQRLGVQVRPDEPVVLGFDGSRSRARGVADATALIGCRVADGHVFEVRVWEQPPGPQGRGWRVPIVEVEAEIRAAFERWTVVGFYADPAQWQSQVAAWEAEYGELLQVRATRAHPVEWWMTGGRTGLIVQATAAFESAVLERDLSHDGAAALTRHVLNARRRVGRAGVQIMKATPESPAKIDAAVAAVLAYQCRLDALSAGLAEIDLAGPAPFRIR